MGLVDLSPSMEPVHELLISTDPIKTVILNGCEPEPYLTCDHALVMAKAMEILKGAELIRRAANAEQVILFFRKDQLEAIELVRSKI